MCGSVRVNEGTIAARFDSDSAGPTCLKTAIVFARFHVLFDERKGRAGDLEQERSGGKGRGVEELFIGRNKDAIPQRKGNR
jgi:hypothetical protein